MDNSTKKTRPGAQKPSPRATGSGPVWEIRNALGLTRKQLAEKIGCSEDTIRNCEKTGTLPESAAAQSNLHWIAPATPPDVLRRTERASEALQDLLGALRAVGLPDDEHERLNVQINVRTIESLVKDILNEADVD